MGFLDLLRDLVSPQGALPQEEKQVTPSPPPPTYKFQPREYPLLTPTSFLPAETLASVYQFAQAIRDIPYEDTDMTQHYLGRAPVHSAFLDIPPPPMSPEFGKAASFESCRADNSASLPTRHIRLCSKPVPSARQAAAFAGAAALQPQCQSGTPESSREQSMMDHSVYEQQRAVSNASLMSERYLQAVQAYPPQSHPTRAMDQVEETQQYSRPASLGPSGQPPLDPREEVRMIEENWSRQTSLPVAGIGAARECSPPTPGLQPETPGNLAASSSTFQLGGPSTTPDLQKTVSLSAEAATVPSEPRCLSEEYPRRSASEETFHSAQQDCSGSEKDLGPLDECLNETDSAPPFYRPRFDYAIDSASVDSSPPFYRPRRDPMIFEFESSDCSDSLACSELAGDFYDSEISRCLDGLENSNLVRYGGCQASGQESVCNDSKQPSNQPEWARLSAEAISASLTVDQQWAALSREAMAGSSPLDGSELFQQAFDDDDPPRPEASSGLTRSTPPDSDQEESYGKVAAQMPEGLAGTGVNVLNRGDCYYLTGEIEEPAQDSIIVPPGEEIPEGYQPVRYHYTMMPIEKDGSVGKVMASFRSLNPAIFGSSAQVVGGDFVTREDGTLQVWNLAKTNWTPVSDSPIPLTREGRVQPQITMQRRHRELTPEEFAQLAARQMR